MACDETALICDFAETYGVYDWRALPLKTAAALAAGLHEDSRSVRKLTGAPAGMQTLLLAALVDEAHVLVWQNTKDGAAGRNRPKSVLRTLLGEEDNDSPGEGFATVEEYRAWHREMMEE